MSFTATAGQTDTTKHKGSNAKASSSSAKKAVQSPEIKAQDNRAKGDKERASAPEPSGSPQLRTFRMPAVIYSPPSEWAWYLVVMVSLLACVCIGVQFFAIFHKQQEISPPETAALSSSIKGLERNAEAAKASYQALAARVSSAPPAPTSIPGYVAPAAAPELRRSAGSITRPTNADPLEKPMYAEPPPVTILGAYLLVRAAKDLDKAAAEERFEREYHSTRLECKNLDDLRSDENAILRFEEYARGPCVLVPQGNQGACFPYFFSDPLEQRDRMKNIFDYPDGNATSFRLRKPATLVRQGDEWILKAPGAFEADG